MTDAHRIPHPPRVCILTDSFSPIVGGGEKHAELLGNALIRRGAEVFVITRQRVATHRKLDCVGSIPVYRVWPCGFDRIGKYLMLLPALVMLIRLRRQYDVVYVCALRVQGVAGMLAARALGKVCVLRSEACGEMSGAFASGDLEPQSWKRRLVDRAIALRNRLYRRADCFVAISGPIREEYLSAGVPPERIAAIPNGVDTELHRPADAARREVLRKELGLPSGRLWIYTGKLNRGKGLEMLLAAWSRICAERADVHLALVGGGANQFLSCESDLREIIARERLEDRVTLTGYVTNVDEYLQASDGFVLPSESEAMPISLLEAFSCGLPCVATRAGGIVDVVEHERTGLLSDVADEAGLTDNLRRLLDDPDLGRALGTAARRAVLSHYGIDAVADRHVELFASLRARRAA